MLTINSIIKEINELPVERLEYVYEFIHTLNTKHKHSRERTLSYAGIFRDMSKDDYADFVASTKKTRANLFDRDSQI